MAEAARDINRIPNKEPKKGVLTALFDSDGIEAQKTTIEKLGGSKAKELLAALKRAKGIEGIFEKSGNRVPPKGKLLEFDETEKPKKKPGKEGKLTKQQVVEINNQNEREI